MRAENGSEMFSRTERCISSASARSAATKTRPDADGVGGVAERDGLAVDEQRSRRRPLGARQEVEQLVLALALERDDAQDLARVEVEGGVAQATADR